jgi:hypothetical protein
MTRVSLPAGLLARRVAFVLAGGLLALASSIEAYWGDISQVTLPLTLAMLLYMAPLFLPAKTDPFEPASFGGLYHGYGVAGSLAVLLVGQRVELGLLRHVSPTVQLELVRTVAWSYVVAISSYYVGYYSPWARRFWSIFPRIEGIEWDRKRLLLVLALCFAIFVPVYAIFQARLGLGLSELTDLGAGKRAMRGDDRMQTWIVRGMLIGLLPPMLLLGLYLPRRLKRAEWLVLAGLVGFMALLILRTGVRSFVGFFILSCVVLFHYLRRRLSVGAVFGMAFAAILIMNVLGELRFQETDEAPRESLSSRIVRPVDTLAAYESDRGRMEALAVVFHSFPDRKEYLWGASWFGFLLTPIPRWVWPEKVEYIKWADHGIVYQLTGAPIPVQFHGALFANFSWLGVGVGMALWGLFQRAMYEWLQRDPRDRNKVILYSSMLVLIAPSVLIVMNLLQFVVPLWLIVRFLDRRLGRARGRAPALGPSPS